MKKILKNWRITTAVLLLAIFLNWQIIEAATDDSSKYSSDHYDTFYDSVTAYHTNINDIFNKRLELLVSGEGEREVPTACSEDNVTTYCVAEAVTKEYIEFTKGVDTFSYVIDVEDGKKYLIDDLTQIMSDRATIIDLEKEAAYKAMDMTLAIYNEFQIMYPIHLEYEATIEALESYNKQLSKWRDALSEWPTDFIDVSTNKCS
ncbi:MAG: hypothetical protein ABII07_04760 [Patescibacteria group bacterium]|nr:hypothetical protein [Patescibacteria group bacterium]